MAFFVLDLYGSDNLPVQFEEGTLRRKNARGGAERSAGGALMLDRSAPWDTFTVDTVLLDTDEFELIYNRLASDTTGLKRGFIEGDYAGAGEPGVFVMIRMTGWRFEDSRYRRISLEIYNGLSV